MAESGDNMGQGHTPSDRPMFVISVAAELANVHPQTLRMYEKKELIRPQRSSGRVRLYSEADIEWVKEIQVLTQNIGINLAGVRRIMELQEELRMAQERIEDLREEAARIEESFRAEVAEVICRYSPQIMRYKSSIPAHRRPLK